MALCDLPIGNCIRNYSDKKSDYKLYLVIEMKCKHNWKQLYNSTGGPTIIDFGHHAQYPPSPYKETEGFGYEIICTRCAKIKIVISKSVQL